MSIYVALAVCTALYLHKHKYNTIHMPNATQIYSQ